MTARPSQTAPTSFGSGALWRTAQLTGVLATLVLLTGLVVQPDAALTVLWNVLIPLVPASLLVSPAIWRNVCPLATLSMAANRSAGKRVLTSAALPTAGLIGIVLLVVMVPARRFLFNTDGLVLALTIAAVAALAIVLGAVFQLKAGFCNAICPVLPVERLYGQSPMLRINNPRCTPCTMCTQSGCIDLAPRKSIAKTLGNSRTSRAWLTSGYGAFAAAFPGFVVGYYTTQDGALATAGAVYLNVIGWAAASYLLTALLVWVTKASALRAMTMLAATAAAVYYWYAADTITTAFAIQGAATLTIRVAAFALIAVWLWRALTPSTGNGSRTHTA
jgi:hypothetical protein